MKEMRKYIMYNDICKKRGISPAPDNIFFGGGGLLLAVSQSHSPPTKNGNLFVFLTDYHCFALGVYTAGTVYIIQTVGVPDAAIAAIYGAGNYHCLFGRLDDTALFSYLPTALVLNGLALAECHSVIVGELANRANIDAVSGSSHFFYLSFFDVLIIADMERAVKRFCTEKIIYF